MSSLLDRKLQPPFLKKLLAWYKKQGRHDMPWRKTKDPYAIFVSEYMLQQTTVATVRPYYDRFLKKFPTVQSLAKSDINGVLALWSGLGYYARGRNLWTAARQVVKDYDGKIPSEPEDLQKLPGVGFYTAGAIATLAYNKAAPVLDGNIIRVYMRLLGVDDDPRLKAVQVLLRKIGMDFSLIALGDRKRTPTMKNGPRDVVLALMDLGATLCAPKNPKCSICPVAQYCLAKANGKQEDIPRKQEKVDRPIVRRCHAVIAHKGKILMGQRPKQGLFGGLWEFVGVDLPMGVEPVPYLEKQIEDQLDLPIRVEQALRSFEHQLSHRIYVVRSFLCHPLRFRSKLPKSAKTDDYDRFRWIAANNFGRLGLSSVTKRIMNELNEVKL